MAIDLFGANEKGNPNRKDYDRVYKWFINNVLPSKHWAKLLIAARRREHRLTMTKLLELQSNK